MSYGRIRSRVTPASAGWGLSRRQYFGNQAFGQPQSTMVHNAVPTNGPFVYGENAYEYIDDRVTQPGVSRQLNPVWHERYEASIVTSTMGFCMQPYYPDVTDLWVVDHGLAVNYNPSVADLPSAQWASLCSQLATKLNGGLSRQSLIGASVMEARKTYAMIRNPFNLLKADWRKIAGKDSAKSLAKSGANVWLEANYGWRSAYLDVRGISNTADTLYKTSPEELQEELDDRYSVSQTDKWSGERLCYQWYDNTYGWPSWNDGENYNFPDQPARLRVRVESQNVTRRVYCRQQMAVAKRWSRSRRFLNAWGMDTSSIADVLWELAPFSFVIDWFVDPLGLWKLPGSIMRLSQTDVSSIGHSEKVESCFRAQGLLHSGYPWYGTPWGYKIGAWRLPSKTTGSLGRHHVYGRWLGLPNWSDLLSSLTGSGLNAFKTISGSALTVQRLLSNKRFHP